MKEIIKLNFESILWSMWLLIIVLIIVIPITIGTFKDKEIKMKELEIQSNTEIKNEV